MEGREITVQIPVMARFLSSPHGPYWSQDPLGLPSNEYLDLLPWEGWGPKQPGLEPARLPPARTETKNLRIDISIRLLAVLARCFWFIAHSIFPYQN